MVTSLMLQKERALLKKKAMGIHLGASEENFLANLWSDRNLQRKESLGVVDGKLRWSKSANVDAVFEEVKFRAEGLTRATRDKTGNLYLGSIDEITARNWAKECGYGIGTKGFADHAQKKLQSNEFSKFRADIN